MRLSSSGSFGRVLPRQAIPWVGICAVALASLNPYHCKLDAHAGGDSYLAPSSVHSGLAWHLPVCILAWVFFFAYLAILTRGGWHFLESRVTTKRVTWHRGSARTLHPGNENQGKKRLPHFCAAFLFSRHRQGCLITQATQPRTAGFRAGPVLPACAFAVFS